MCRAGTPATIVPGSVSPVTTEPAPMRFPSAIVTPGVTTALAPFHGSSPSVVVAAGRGPWKTIGRSGHDQRCCEERSTAWGPHEHVGADREPAAAVEVGNGVHVEVAAGADAVGV